MILNKISAPLVAMIWLALAGNQSWALENYATVNLQGNELQVAHTSLAATEPKKNITFVLVHGLGCDMTFWEKQIDLFSNYGRVVLMDLPGHGKSDSADIEYSMPQMVEVISAILSANEISEDFVLVGHSLGVAIVREYVKLHPENVSALIAFDGPLYYSAPPEEDAIILRSENFKSMYDDMVDRYADESSSTELHDKIAASMKSLPVYITKRLAIEMYEVPSIPNVQLEFPILYMVPENSPWAGKDEQKKIRTIADQVDFQVVARGGHFFMYDYPSATNRIVESFIKRLQP